MSPDLPLACTSLSLIRAGNTTGADQVHHNADLFRDFFRVKPYRLRHLLAGICRVPQDRRCHVNGFSPSPSELLIEAKRAIALAKGGLAKLRAVSDGARSLAIPVRHGLIGYAVVLDELLEQADNCGVADDVGEHVVAETIEAGLADFNGDGTIEPNGSRPLINWREPDWSILDDRRGDLPDFPTDALSGACEEWAQRAAHGAGVTIDHVVVPLLGIVSSLIGTARRVMPSRSWSEPLTLWTAAVGFSGTGKTPGINVTRRALAQVERDRRTKIADLQRAHETRVEVAKAARKKWKDEIEEAAQGAVVSLDKFRSTKSAEPPRLIPAEAVDPGPFEAPRLYVSNTTIEKMAVLLQARPQGMLLLTDELAGLFLNMSRYSGGTDAEFWLEAWCGGPYRVERMNRPSIDLDHLLVGLVGGLQPDKLARSFAGDLDGMYARVLFSWPPKAPYKPLSDEVTEVEPEIINILNRIVNLEGGQDQEGGFAPRAVPLSQPAVAVRTTPKVRGSPRADPRGARARLGRQDADPSPEAGRHALLSRLGNARWR
jgi:hypothetical protein